MTVATPLNTKRQIPMVKRKMPDTRQQSPKAYILEGIPTGNDAVLRQGRFLECRPHYPV
jgi:hypothetical protein